MEERAAFVRAILGPDSISDAEAGSVVASAQSLGIDLLVFLAHRCGLAEDEVYRRAAQFCSLPFAARIPRNLRVTGEVSRLDRLAEIRSVRGVLEDREVLFLAPPAEEMLAIAEHRRRHPEFARTICIAPPSAVRRHMVRRHGKALTVHARQNLSRLWPFASAHLDLTRPARLVFVVMLAAMVALAAFAPFHADTAPALLLAVIFVPGAWMRLTALVEKDAARPEDDHPLLTNAELPVYSVLIPLRDETAMVPQLVRAMQAMDYPALCIKRTKGYLRIAPGGGGIFAHWCAMAAHTAWISL